MIVIVHRWQQNRGNYNNQKFELFTSEWYSEGVACPKDGEETFWGAVFDGRIKPEPGMKKFATQKVDRIEVDSYKNEVHIYTSALVERKHEPRGKKVDTDAALKVYEPLPPRANSVPIDTCLCSCFSCSIGDHVNCNHPQTCCPVRTP